MFQLADFSYSLKYISQKLNITEDVVNEAIDRLIKVGLLKLTENNKMVLTEEFTAGPDGIPSKTIQEHHLQLLQKAVQSISNQGVNERDISSITMAFDSKKLSEAKIKIKKFRRSFNKEMTLGGDKNEVYCLSVQFFRLTNINQGEKNV